MKKLCLSLIAIATCFLSTPHAYGAEILVKAPRELLPLRPISPEGYGYLKIKVGGNVPQGQMAEIFYCHASPGKAKDMLSCETENHARKPTEEFFVLAPGYYLVVYSGLKKITKVTPYANVLLRFEN